MTAIPSGKPANHYRPDIDGLRAVAVLAVVIYHIQESLLSGGFAGVDVFFVISGFLITGNLHRQISESQFSFRDFYRRRLLRIFPPLIVVLLATVLIGQFVMLPNDFVAMTKSAFASILSVANFYFLFSLDTSYFAAEASVHPLLHIWSLGVEEQFYIFWPFLLLAFIKIGIRGLMIMTLVIGTASFGLAELVVRDHPMFAYYMLPTRAGQLMTGAFVYFATRSDRFQLASGLREMVAIIGLVLMLSSLWLIDGAVPFPGLSALPVTLGTAAIIWVGTNVDRKPLANRLLGIQPMIWIGLLSYSFYLWHWPVFAYWKYLYGTFTFASGAMATLTALGLSFLTYHFVEQKFRRWPGTFPKIVNRAFVLPCVLLGLVVFGTTLSKGQGVYAVTNYSEKLASQQTSVSASTTAEYVCQSRRLNTSKLTDPLCAINEAQDEPKILLWGDSNAGHFVGTLAALGGEYGFSFRNLVHASCPPFIESAGEFVVQSQKENCQTSADLVISRLDNYDLIVLAAAWNNHLSKSSPNGREALEATVDVLTSRGKQVVIMSKIAIHQNADPECVMKRVKVGFLRCEYEGIPLSGGIREVNGYLKGVADSRPNVAFFDVTTPLCPNGLCSPYIGEELSYYDKSHLSLDGSWALGNLIIDQHMLPKPLEIAPRLSPAAAGGHEALKESLKKASESFDVHARAGEGYILFDPKRESEVAVIDWQGRDSGVLENGYFLLTDDDEDRYVQMSTNFTLREIGFKTSTGGSIVIESMTSLARTDSPVLNLQVTFDDRPERYEVLYNIEKRETFLKRQAAAGNSKVSLNGDDLSLAIGIKAVSEDTRISIKVVAAASHGTVGYKRDATGKTALKQIRVFGIEPNVN